LDYSTLKEYDSEIADKVKLSLDVAKQLSSVLASGLNGNPRQCKRFLNAMEMRLSMANYKGINLDRRILAKIMMLEYFKSSALSDLMDAETAIDGSITELRQLEESLVHNIKVNKLEKLKNWQEDNWIKNWIQTEPYLGSEDLRPYFYFVRTSHDKRYEMAVMKLSRDAQDVLNNLLAGTESGLISAKQKANSVNDYEAGLIIEHLFERIKESSDIEDTQLKVILEWGIEKKEVYSEIIAGLESINGSRIKPVHIPRVMHFGSEAGKLSGIEDILDKWVKENPNLFSIVAQERKH